MDGLLSAYEAAWTELIKPPRRVYADQDVGPECLATPEGTIYARRLMSVANREG